MIGHSFGLIGTSARVIETGHVVKLLQPNKRRVGYVTVNTWLVLQANGQRAYVRADKLEAL